MTKKVFDPPWSALSRGVVGSVEEIIAYFDAVPSII